MTEKGASGMKKLLFPLIILIVAFLGLNARTELNTKVLIRTDFGDIMVEIYESQAPVTSANFFRYVDAGLFKGASFSRFVRLDNQPNNAVKIEVIQGGLEFSKDKKPFPPIPHETTDKT